MCAFDGCPLSSPLIPAESSVLVYFHATAMYYLAEIILQCFYLLIS